MKVIITRSYSCAPEGHTVVKFSVNDIVDGKAAALALADGAGIEAQIIDTLETKVDASYEPKRRGRPPKVRGD